MARKADRQRLERTVTLLQQKWGRQAIHKGAARAERVPRIATGFAELDAVLGGGVPRGQVTVLSGAPTSGKVTLAARVLARAQARGRMAAYVDLAHTCDADYLQRCGVRLRHLLVVRPQDGRQALEMTLLLAERAQAAAILFDHWGLLGQDRAGRDHRAAALAHLAGRLAQNGVALLVLNDPPALWQRLLPAWGDALLHYAALHLALSQERWFMAGPDIRGYLAQAAVHKHKFGPAGQRVPIEIRFNGAVHGQGI